LPPGAASQTVTIAESRPPAPDPSAPLLGAFQVRIENVVRSSNFYGFLGVVEQGTVHVPCNARRVRATQTPESGMPIPIVRADFNRQRVEEVRLGTNAAFELRFPPEAVEKGFRRAPMVANIYGLENGDLLVSM
jgi:hypothetical protein